MILYKITWSPLDTSGTSFWHSYKLVCLRYRIIASCLLRLLVLLSLFGVIFLPYAFRIGAWCYLLRAFLLDHIAYLCCPVAARPWALATGIQKPGAAAVRGGGVDPYTVYAFDCRFEFFPGLTEPLVFWRIVPVFESQRNGNAAAPLAGWRVFRPSNVPQRCGNRNCLSGGILYRIDWPTCRDEQLVQITGGRHSAQLQQSGI